MSNGETKTEATDSPNAENDSIHVNTIVHTGCMYEFRNADFFK